MVVEKGRTDGGRENIVEEGWLGLPLLVDQRVCTECKIGHAETFIR